jgi:hypothetical protein
MPPKIAERFVALSPEQTRCPEKIRSIAPSAKKIYVLRERFDCRHWDIVRDLFHQVSGSHIVTQPTAGRKYFTLDPETVASRLRKAGVW